MDRIQLRRDTAARWAEINPVLLEGEVGFETDTRLRKIGDGVNRWNELDYLKAEGIVNDLTTGGADKALSAEMGKELDGKLTELEEKIDGGSDVYLPINVEGGITINSAKQYQTSINIKKGKYNLSFNGGGVLAQTIIMFYNSANTKLNVRLNDGRLASEVGTNQYTLFNPIEFLEDVSYVKLYSGTPSTDGTISLTCTNTLGVGLIDEVEALKLGLTSATDRLGVIENTINGLREKYEVIIPVIGSQPIDTAHSRYETPIAIKAGTYLFSFDGGDVLGSTFLSFYNASGQQVKPIGKDGVARGEIGTAQFEETNPNTFAEDVVSMKLYGGTPSANGNLNFGFVNVEKHIGLVDEISELKKASEKSDTSYADCLYDRDFIAGNAGYYLDVTSSQSSSFENDAYLEQKIRKVPSGKHFIAFTDYHQEANKGNSMRLISYVRKRLGIDKVAFLGDCMDRGEINGVPNRYEGARKLTKFATEFFGAFGSGAIWVMGNHDTNSNGQNYDTLIPDVEAYERTVKNMSNIVNDDEALENWGKVGLSTDDADAIRAWQKLTYYVDDAKAKVRYIVLETMDGGIALQKLLGITGYWSDLSRFITQFLIAKALKTLPYNYDVVILGHMLGSENGARDRAVNEFVNLLNAFRNKTSITLSYNTTYDDYLTDTFRLWFALMEKSYDFSNAESANHIMILSGHFHWDSQLLLSQGKVSTEYDGSLITNDNYLFVRLNRDAYNRQVSNMVLESDKSWEMVSGTITDQCFDVVTIAEDGNIYCTRFGAGVDRVFKFVV